MKKLISLSLCFAFLFFCGCSTVTNTVQLKSSYSQSATVTTGEYTYTANVRYDGKCVYITPTSTNASGMTISCNGKTVAFSRRDMINEAEKSKVSPYNPAVLLYDAFTSAELPKKSNNGYIFGGKTAVGNYTLTVDKSARLLSFVIPDADFSIEFDVK